MFIPNIENTAQTSAHIEQTIHCKKNVRDSWICFDQTFLGLGLLFPARESLVSDIPAGDGNTLNLFYSVQLSVYKLFLR